MRDIPDACVDLVKRFEGLRLEPYHDAGGFPTIGYGRLLSREAWADLSRWSPITEDDAAAMLRVDLQAKGRAVEGLCPVPLTDEQFGALVSFAFNCGAGNLQVSTLRKKVNRGEHECVPDEFMRWVRAGAVRLPGLVRRRRAEADLYAAAGV